MTTAYTRGIDYSFARPDPADAHRQGARFVIRYSAGAASAASHPSHSLVRGKLCTKAEFRAALAAGLDVVANSEWYESRITEGTAAGKADGAADLAFWRAIGLAKGSSIYVSWDEGQPATGKHAKVAAYLKAYQGALDGYYHADLYAGDVALRDMLGRKLIRYGWRAMADSWSSNGSYYQPGGSWKSAAEKVAKVSPAHIWQNGNYWYGNGADENVILRTPIGSHLEATGGKTSGGSGGGSSTSKPKPTKPTSSTYTVKSGDTMSGIAAAHGMSLGALEKLNPSAGHPAGNFDLIRPGDRLKVSGSAPSTGKAVHVVKAGDTLSSIAAGWGVSLAAVERANPHAGHPAGHFDTIWPGDRITHP